MEESFAPSVMTTVDKNALEAGESERFKFNDLKIDSFEIERLYLMISWINPFYRQCENSSPDAGKANPLMTETAILKVDRPAAVETFQATTYKIIYVYSVPYEDRTGHPRSPRKEMRCAPRRPCRRSKFRSYQSRFTYPLGAVKP